MRARGLFIAAACAALLLVAPSASVATKPPPRHVEYAKPTDHGVVYLGEHGGYEIAVSFLEPDYAILTASNYDPVSRAGSETAYGAHFSGSLLGGKVHARFGAIGSIALRFVPDGKVRSDRLPKDCEGQKGRDETGHFIGRVDLRGESDYFRAATGRAEGHRDLTFRLRCQAPHRPRRLPAHSLTEIVTPSLYFGSSGGPGVSLAKLEATAREGGREIAVLAEHHAGAPRGAEVQAGTFEHQGKMPVGRAAFAPLSGGGTLVTSLPGEHPATATLMPEAPFSGEATYLASSPTEGSLTGDLVVQFPGLLQPLDGPGFSGSLCVASALGPRDACPSLITNLETGE